MLPINQLLQQRRSVFPDQYNNEPVTKAFIEQLLENANWAPNHKHTEPWRFKVFHSEESKVQLGNFLAEKFKETSAEGKFSEFKYKKLQANPVKAGAIIAICMQKDPKQSLPEWEEVAATAMAVQNMYLTCTANGVGGYWSSPGLIKFMGEHIELNDGEECLGFFYVGNYDGELPEGKRKPIADKTVWVK
ncbi:nitroreductase [Zhouia sp. PK063]|uniref:nitroreductase n=1 Tax=Zhouia sp. PK063 TaxID=3373602 RepID=UPI0037A8BBC6